MGVLQINADFCNKLAQGHFLNGMSKMLTIHYTTNEGSRQIKEVSEGKKYILNNVNKIQNATYGINNYTINVTDKMNELLVRDKIINDFTLINKKFKDFCNAFLKMVCPRCYMNETKCKINPHNSGYINYLLKTHKIINKKVIFDGLTRCFIAYVLNDDSNITKNKKDSLNKFFCHLLIGKYIQSDLYRQTIQISEYYLNGSREREIIVLSNKIKKSTNILLTGFFKYIYPCLQYFYMNQNDVFIRHGLEKTVDQYNSSMIFPPNDTVSGWRIHKVTGINGRSEPTILPAYPIEIDKFPFTECASHSSDEIYGNVKGYISQSNFKSYKGKIHIRYEDSDKIMARDHLFAESNISIKHWYFTYRMKAPEKLKKTVKNAIKNIMVSDIPIIAEEPLIIYKSIVDIIMNKIVVLQ